MAYNAVVSTSETRRRPPITDSPWYWVYLFCTGGLVALVLVGPKFAAKQSRIERNYEARQRAAQHVAGRTRPEAEPQSPRTGTRIGLQPLFITLAIVLSLAWCNLWWRHYRGATAKDKPAFLEKATE
ncbi:MAG: hypothetical protein CMJ64_29500 [Planctomycetaceae bacterium]|nr:hypothetical protein [Planctomycetaceae bacterium]